MIRNEASVNAFIREFWFAQQGAQEADIRRDTGNGEFVQCALSTGHSNLEIRTTASHFHQQRVKIRGDLSPDRGSAIQTYTRTARRTVRRDRAGIRAEAVGRILSGNTALQRGTG